MRGGNQRAQQVLGFIAQADRSSLLVYFTWMRTKDDPGFREGRLFAGIKILLLAAALCRPAAAFSYDYDFVRGGDVLSLSRDIPVPAPVTPL